MAEDGSFGSTIESKTPKQRCESLLTEIGRNAEELAKIKPMEGLSGKREAIGENRLRLRREFLALLTSGQLGMEPATVISIALDQLAKLERETFE